MSHLAEFSSAECFRMCRIVVGLEDIHLWRKDMPFTCITSPFHRSIPLHTWKIKGAVKSNAQPLPASGLRTGDPFCTNVISPTYSEDVLQPIGIHSGWSNQWIFRTQTVCYVGLQVMRHMYMHGIFVYITLVRLGNNITTHASAIALPKVLVILAHRSLSQIETTHLFLSVVDLWLRLVVYFSEKLLQHLACIKPF